MGIKIVFFFCMWLLLLYRVVIRDFSALLLFLYNILHVSIFATFVTFCLLFFILNLFYADSLASCLNQSGPIC